jgi:hypothetical protein
MEKPEKRFKALNSLKAIKAINPLKRILSPRNVRRRGAFV